MRSVPGVDLPVEIRYLVLSFLWCLITFHCGVHLCGGGGGGDDYLGVLFLRCSEAWCGVVWC